MTIHHVKIKAVNESVLKRCMESTAKLIGIKFKNVDDYLSWLLNRWFEQNGKDETEIEVRDRAGRHKRDSLPAKDLGGISDYDY